MNVVIKMLVTLSFIGLLSGGLLSNISNWAEPFIEAHKKEETKQAIFDVQPKAEKFESVKAQGLELYRVSNSENPNLGYAFAYEGNGFQGKIRLMFGTNSDFSELTGLKILEQVETPGLGTKVVEDNFTKQFKGLSSVPKIDWVKGVPPSESNEIQAITGATISSKAVVNIINSGLLKVKNSSGIN